MDLSGIIDKLSAIIDTSGRVPGTQRRIVDKVQLEAIVKELKESVPNELREAQEVLRQRDSILNQANLEAQRIRGSAQEEIQALRAAVEEEHRAKVAETEITKEAQQKAEVTSSSAQRSSQAVIQDAQRRAQRILEEAETVSKGRRSGADQYAKEVLFSLEERLAELLAQVRKGIDVLGSPSAPQD